MIMLEREQLLTEPTLTKLQIELVPLPRWQSLGLSSLPTLEELETII